MRDVEALPTQVGAELEGVAPVDEAEVVRLIDANRSNLGR